MYNFISKNNTEIACGLYKSGYSILTFHKALSSDILILVSKQKQSFCFYVVILWENILVCGLSANEKF